jgi:hypothetical protein
VTRVPHTCHKRCLQPSVHAASRRVCPLATQFFHQMLLVAPGQAARRHQFQQPDRRREPRHGLLPGGDRGIQVSLVLGPPKPDPQGAAEEEQPFCAVVVVGRGLRPVRDRLEQGVSSAKASESRIVAGSWSTPNRSSRACTSACRRCRIPSLPATPQCLNEAAGARGDMSMYWCIATSRCRLTIATSEHRRSATKAGLRHRT